MPSNAPRLSASLAVLTVLLCAGCASSPAPHSARAPATKAPTPSEDKAFAEAVERGDAAWQLQDYDRAIYHYVQAANVRPHDAPTLAKMGAIEDARGNVELADKAFTLAYEAQPEDPRIAERLARLYFREGKIDQAGAIYASVLSRDLQRTRALDGMGEVSMARSNFAEAVQYFNRALLADNPDSAAILTHRGRAKLQLNDLAGAEQDLRAALALAPARDEAWRYLGMLQVKTGDTGAAMSSLLHVMDTAQAYNEIGVVLLTANRFSDAHEYFTKAIKASPAWFEAAQKNLAVAAEHLRGSAG